MTKPAKKKPIPAPTRKAFHDLLDKAAAAGSRCSYAQRTT